MSVTSDSYRLLLEQSPDLIFVTNQSGVLYINPAGVKYLGYQTREEIIGRHVHDFIHPDSHEITTKYARLRRAGGNPPSKYRAKLVAKDGEVLNVELHASLITWDNTLASVTIARDIGEQIRLEEELENYNMWLEGFMESADDGFLILDKHMNIVKANQTWLRKADLDKEAVGKNILELFPSLRETERYSGYLRVLETGEPVEFPRVPAISGAGLVYNITVFKVGDGLGVISRDITEIVKKEENLKNLLEKLPDPLTVNDGESFLLVNHALAKLLGYDKPSELTGKPVISIFPPENRETIQERTRARLRGEQLPSRYELELYSKEGPRIEVEVNLSIIEYMGKLVILAVFRDIRERKRVEMLLRAESRLSSILLDPDRDIMEITEEILEEVKKLTLSEHGYVAKLDENTGDLVVYTFTLMNEICEVDEFQARFPVNPDGTYNGLWGYTLNTKKSYYTNDYTQDKHRTELPDGHISIRNFLSVPVLHGDNLVGQICLANSIREYTDKDAEAVERLAQIYGLAIHRIQNLELLEQSQTRLSDFVMNAKDGFVLLDEDMRYVMVNDAELELTGLNREDYIGKHLTEIFPSVLTSGRYRGYERVLETGEPVTYQGVKSVRGGDLVFDFYGFKAGDMLGIVSRDVTESVEYREKLLALNNASIQFSEADRVEIVFDTVLDMLHKDLNYTWAGIAKVEERQLRYIKATESFGATSLVIPLDGRGVTVRAVETGEPQLVPDTRRDPDYLVLDGFNWPNLSELAVPVTVDGKVSYVINLESDTLDAFTDNDVNIMQLLSRQLSSTVKNIRLQAYRETIGTRVKALNRFGVEIAELNSVEDIASYTLDSGFEILNQDTGGFGVVIDGAIHIVESRRPTTIPLIPLDQKSITTRAVKTGLTQLVSDTRRDSDYLNGRVKGEESLSELAVPVNIEGKCVAILNFESNKVDGFTKDDAMLVEILADHIAASLKRLSQHEKILNTQRWVVREHERAEQAIMLEEMKTSFIRTATHELRTPLTSMKGFLELALAEKDLNDAREYLRVAARNTERLEALTNDLLDQQRIEDGRLDLDRGRLELVQLVEVAVDEVRPMLDERGQRLELKSPSDRVFVYGDQLRLIQVLVNLLDNASKYSPDGSLIKVMVLVDGDWVCVSVVDEGYGLTGEDIEKLFMPFPDIERPTLTEQSVGLGLSICKGIIDMHGGEIWAESPGLGEGSTFVFKLPGRVKDE